MSGKVYLIGAGPGDPELLTLKAVRALGECQVLLVDDLVNPAILSHAPSARIVGVGKRGGCKSTPQAFIEKLMLRYARHGKTVGRVKGGDPFIFGRGGEEVAALRAAGVDYEVINGITAGLAGATNAGIPLTHRAACRGVTLITGHTQDGDTSGAPNWSALAKTDTTLVVYMGVKNLRRMQSGLLAGGMSSAMPVAIIERSSLPDERQTLTTLGELPSVAARVKVQSPAILVIGEVVAQAEGWVLSNIGSIAA